jgi:5'-3' exonuclease
MVRREESKKRRKKTREKLEEKEERQERRKKNKQKPPMHLQVSYLAAPKMVMMMSLSKCIARRTRKERARRMMTTNMSSYPLTILLCL